MLLNHKCPTCAKMHELEATPEPSQNCQACREKVKEEPCFNGYDYCLNYCSARSGVCVVLNKKVSIPFRMRR